MSVPLKGKRKTYVLALSLLCILSAATFMATPNSILAAKQDNKSGGDDDSTVQQFHR